MKSVRQYKPDASVKITVWTTPAMKKLVDRICRKWEAFESDVLRTTLEAMVPVLAREGFRAYLTERQMEELMTPFNKGASDAFRMKITVRTSVATRVRFERLSRQEKMNRAESMRLTYAAGLPLAWRKGMSHLHALREAEIGRKKK